MGKPRYILDTNVIVGAMVAELAPASATPRQHRDLAIFLYARSQGELCFSVDTMCELRDVALDLRGMTSDLGPTTLFNRKQFVDKLMHEATPMQPEYARVRCRDPKDQMFLDLAAGIGASYLISHDYDLSKFDCVHGCRIMEPKKFARQVMGLTEIATPAVAPRPPARPFKAAKSWRPPHQQKPPKDGLAGDLKGAAGKSMAESGGMQARKVYR